MHRRTVAQLATLHFAPTETARSALRAEGIADPAIHVVGNPVIDALAFVAARLAADPVLRRRVATAVPALDPRRPLLLVTAHRRENHGAAMHAIADAVATLAAPGDLDIVVPVHPNPAAGAVLRARLGAVPRVKLVPPLGYFAFVTLLRRARVVLTDSGGVQEEALACGCPALVMRTSTERPEGVDAGTARIVGTDPARIVAAVRALVDDDALHARMTAIAQPYGIGDAAARIAAVLAPLAGVSRGSPRVAA